MILDRIENTARYSPAHMLFGKAFAFLAGHGLADMREGRHDIEGERLFALVSLPEGSGREKARLEAHRKYIDIQVCLKGEDLVGWRAREECLSLLSAYDPEKDREFFSDEPTSWFTLKPGHFAVFYPEDAHAPLAGNGKLHKVVVKVAV